MTKRNHFLGRMRAFVLSAAVAVAAASGSSAQADVVIFQENFSTDAANWKITSNGDTNATWVNSGGADGGGYITRTFTPGTGLSSIAFRAQDPFNSSNDGFVRNWTTSGVDHFTIALRTDSATPLSLNLRFASSANFPGASTNNFVLAASNAWTTISIPIIDSLGPGGVFQTYESDYSSVFSAVGNVQLVIANAGTLPPNVPFNLSVDSATISALF